MLINSLMSPSEIVGLYASEGFSGLRLVPRMTTIEQYYRVMIEEPEYLAVFWNSVRIVVPLVLGQVFFASLAAYALSCFRFKGRNLIFSSMLPLCSCPRRRRLYRTS